jgi:hypothetical protein
MDLTAKLASQARHEQVAQYGTCAARIVVAKYANGAGGSGSNRKEHREHKGGRVSEWVGCGDADWA